MTTEDPFAYEADEARSAWEAAGYPEDERPDRNEYENRPCLHVCTYCGEEITGVELR